MIGMTSASATTYWISATGSDSAAGTSPSTAFATFGKADSVVVPGDTVRVLAGTYNTTVQTYTAGTASARITWISDTKWGAKIVGSTNSGNGNWAVHGDYVTVQNFDITGADIAKGNESGTLPQPRSRTERPFIGPKASAITFIGLIQPPKTVPHTM